MQGFEPGQRRQAVAPWRRRLQGDGPSHTAPSYRAVGLPSQGALAAAYTRRPLAAAGREGRLQATASCWRPLGAARLVPWNADRGGQAGSACRAGTAAEPALALQGPLTASAVACMAAGDRDRATSNAMAAMQATHKALASCTLGRRLGARAAAGTLHFKPLRAIILQPVLSDHTSVCACACMLRCMVVQRPRCRAAQRGKRQGLERGVCCCVLSDLPCFRAADQQSAYPPQTICSPLGRCPRRCVALKHAGLTIADAPPADGQQHLDSRGMVMGCIPSPGTPTKSVLR